MHSGVLVTPEMYKIIAKVDAGLRQILQRGALKPGPSWEDIPCWANNQGSRHDHLVAEMCGSGVWAVRAARARAEAGDFVSKKRGATPTTNVKTHRDAETHADSEPRTDAETNPVAAAFESIGWKENHGVAGFYTKSALQNTRGHAIGLLLGRLILFFILHNIPDYLLPALLSQLLATGVDLGHLHHCKEIISMWSRAALDVICANTHYEFWQPPANLVCPAVWRLFFDSVTLHSGITVLPIMIAFTGAHGRFIVRLLDVIPVGLSGTGQLGCIFAYYF